ncbi:MAG TPA: TonB family protein [Polyangiaceae bacterium]|nr:TonB family protein [Polyangiaceae bacterium]
MHSRRKIGLFLAFCCSVAVHGAAYASLSSEHRTPLAPPPVSQMNFELPPLPAAAPEAESTSNVRQPEAAPSPVTRASTPNQPTRPRLAALTPAIAPAPAAPALDLSGVTLTNDTGSGFAMPVGDGSALHGPIGLPVPREQVGASPSAAPSAAKAPALVDARDLSEHPRPPSLTALLRANYPEQARQRGLRGSASLRARIDADGLIRGARVLSESSAGFGSACRRTVLGSHWSAPRAKNGGAVATEIVYTCHFEVDQ